MISAVSFSCFVLVDSQNVLTATRAFVSLHLFNSLRFSLTFLPSVLAAFSRCKVSLRRLQDFLQANELDLEDVTHNVDEGEAVVFSNASFAWNSAVTLDNLNLRIAEGELVAIVGAVGAGKSSLLSAILGSMKKLTGHVHRKKVPVAYVPQQAWIQNDSIRRNVIFTASYDATFYHNVIDKCCLLPDLQILDEGDMTEIGEKGVNLSGGQKQRISLARAVYQKAQLYLLDDPLSSVDVHVSQALFEDVIGPRGLLNNVTRILVTHSQTVLPFVDKIVLMKEGRIDFVGSYNEFVNMNVSLKTVLGEKEDNVVEEITQPDEADDERLAKKTDHSVEGGSHWDNVARRTEEQLTVGTVPWSLYLMFLKRFGLVYASLCIISCVVNEIGKIATIFWLREWTDDSTRQFNETDSWIHENNGTPRFNDTTAVAWQSHDFDSVNEHSLWRINVFLGLGSIEIIGVAFGCFCLALGCLVASSGLHDDVMGAIFRAPLQFFETMPVGRIVNRLSKDIDVLDLELYTRADGWLACVADLLSAVAVVCVEVPIILCVILPCGVAFVFLLKIYLRNSRQMQRMESAKRSPVLNHFSETVRGSSSIRAFNVEDKFITEFANRLDISQNCMLHKNASATWVSLRVDLLGSFVVLVLSFLIVYHREEFGQGLAGLLLTYSLNTVDGLTWIFRSSSWLEMTVIAAERLNEYTKIPSEKPWEIPGTVDPLWPLGGSLSINNYSTTYREGQREVLQNIKLEVAAGMKVGVVGRTGAGKSSLSLALFRALEATKGSIVIDGIDISRVGLHDLRTRLTIIPQDPVLFRGNLRMNLDPEEVHSDEDLLSVLQRMNLNKTSFSLQMDITDGGSNLSVGERQLVCLARAWLRRSKIIVLDEATAAIDRETDCHIQQTIRKDFAQSTVITIAHRLDTVLDYDMIVVLAEGQIVETGPPGELMESKNSLLYSMAKDAALCE